MLLSTVTHHVLLYPSRNQNALVQLLEEQPRPLVILSVPKLLEDRLVVWLRTRSES